MLEESEEPVNTVFVLFICFMWHIYSNLYKNAIFIFFLILFQVIVEMNQ